LTTLAAILEYADRHGNYYKQVGDLEQIFRDEGTSALRADGVGRPEAGGPHFVDSNLKSLTKPQNE
jgi:hypothetical protein